MKCPKCKEWMADYGKTHEIMALHEYYVYRCKNEECPNFNLLQGKL